MSAEPSVPDYKRFLMKSIEEFKNEFFWAIQNPRKVTSEKIKDFKHGLSNLKLFFSDKIKEEKFIRDLERLEVMIYKLPKTLSEVERSTIHVIFERIEKLLNDLG